MGVTFVVNGTEVHVDASLFATIEDALREALDISGNLGRPIEDWELRYEDGNRVVVGIEIAELVSQPVYATLVLGWGGQ